MTQYDPYDDDDDRKVRPTRAMRIPARRRTITIPASSPTSAKAIRATITAGTNTARKPGRIIASRVPAGTPAGVIVNPVRDRGAVG
jgi:hypothetical protein